MTSQSNTPAAALLRWYHEMGVDAAMDEHPIDRFVQSAAERPSVQERPARHFPASAPRHNPENDRSRGQPAESLLTANADAVVLAAREQARVASTLDELRDALERFEGCVLRSTATQLVFRDGAEKAPIMFVGEAPGAEEDRRGLPFVGRSGQLLDRILAAIKLDRTKVAIANVVPWRPPGNRTPTPQEISACKPFIERQIELVAPQILVCLGAPSAQTLLGVTEGILKLRGRWMTYDRGDLSIRAIATLHPAYLLRQPLQKRLVWRDFRAIQKALAISCD